MRSVPRHHHLERMDIPLTQDTDERLSNGASQPGLGWALLGDRCGGKLALRRSRCESS
jgi:hypothetical protein